jgi:hypothetical protein
MIAEIDGVTLAQTLGGDLTTEVSRGDRRRMTIMTTIWDGTYISVPTGEGIFGNRKRDKRLHFTRRNLAP